MTAKRDFDQEGINRLPIQPIARSSPPDIPQTTYEQSQPTTTTTTTDGDDDDHTQTYPTSVTEHSIASCYSNDGIGCTSSTTSSFEEPSERPADCSGDSTYAGSVPPTEYSTVTQSITVGPEKGADSIDGPTLITPPPPCEVTIIFGTFPLAAFTSTVLVTKKTAVPYSEPTDPPIFTDPPDTEPQTTDPPDSGDGEGNVNGGGDVDGDGDIDCEDLECNVLPPDDEGESSDGGCSDSDSDCDSSITGGNVSPENTSSATVGESTTPDESPDEISNNNGDETEEDSFTVGGVPIIVGPSTIQIGANLITGFVTATSPTTIVANGQTFTIDESEVIGPSTTIPIPAADADSEPTLSPITADGITFSIGPTEAVISGTTYIIGPNASPTTTVIDGQTITIGSDGLSFPSTTIAPPPAATSTATGGATESKKGSSTSSLLVGGIVALLSFSGVLGFL